MPALNHVHTYERIPGKKDQFHCTDPHCYHIISKSRLHKKASRCPSCGQEFILTHEMLKRAVPKCLNCCDTKAAREHQAAGSLARNVLGFLSDAESMPRRED